MGSLGPWPWICAACGPLARTAAAAAAPASPATAAFHPARLSLPAQLWLWLVASVIMGLSDYISVFIGISLGGTALVLLVPLALEVMPPAHRERFYRWTSNCCRVVTCGRVYPGKGDLPLPQGIHP